MKKGDEKRMLRSLHPIKEGKRKWRFATTTIVRAKLHGSLADHKDCDFIDGRGICRSWIRAGYIYVNVRYAWNGCSPKSYIGYPPIGKWIGTPDFDDTIIPSLIHDVLFQWSKCGTYTFHATNWQFYQMMLERQFKLSEQYYDAVECFGEKFWGQDAQQLKVIFQ